MLYIKHFGLKHAIQQNTQLWSEPIKYMNHLKETDIN